MGMGYDKSKFVFSETFNNGNGKTSGSGFMGIVLGLVGSACLIASMVGWFLQTPNVIEVMGKIIIVLTLSASLLGLRKFVATRNGASVGGDGNGNGNGNPADPGDDADAKDPIVDAAKPPVLPKG